MKSPEGELRLVSDMPEKERINALINLGWSIVSTHPYDYTQV